jgi:hypothetical protein
MKEY